MSAMDITQRQAEVLRKVVETHVSHGQHVGSKWLAEQSDMRMLRQKIMDRGCAGFLHAGHDEIDAVNFATSEKIRLHVPNN